MTRNWGQRRCRYCGSRGGDYGNHAGNCLPKEEVDALIAYKKQHGRTWRATLRAHWAAGGEELRILRNTVGPSGLDRILKN